MDRVADLRQKADVYKRLAQIRTSGGHGSRTNSITRPKTWKANLRASGDRIQTLRTSPKLTGRVF